MNADLQVALVGLVGVIVGVGISEGLSYWRERRKERLEVRRAARLIDADLLLAVTVARGSIERKEWWPALEHRLTTDGWQQYRAVIASELTEERWVAVMVSILAVGDLQWRTDAAYSLELAKLAIDPATAEVAAAAEARGVDITGRAAIPDDQVAQLLPVLKDLEAGRAALVPLTRDD